MSYRAQARYPGVYGCVTLNEHLWNARSSRAMTSYILFHAMPYYTYILASKKNGTLYVGVTNDLVRRIYEHKTDAVPGFTKRYNIKLLVYFEAFDDIERAIAREKRLKEWPRIWKLRLIERDNPLWRDRYEEITT
ncbi:MAG: GIY-YIG nuclease family protein [Rhodospirillaceae bacterium]|nr:GIY-YIG nuclease family protein [Rhodospirillaceae bacterium]